MGVTPRGTTTLEKRIKKIRATKQGATDVAGTARKAPTTSRGSGRKTVVSGDPVKPSSALIGLRRKRRKKVLARQAHEERRSTALKTRGAGKARAIKQGQAGRTERARRKSSM